MGEYTTFNKNKFKAMIHYIVDKCGQKQNVGRTVLYKLLYFSEFNYFELYEEYIAHEDYKKYPMGPIPVHYLDIKDELIDEGKIEEETIKIDLERTQYKVISLIKPNSDILTKVEKEVIDSVITKIGHMTASEISEYSHKDMPWMATNDKGIIDYGFVFYRDDEYSVREYDNEI